MSAPFAVALRVYAAGIGLIRTRATQTAWRSVTSLSPARVARADEKPGSGGTNGQRARAVGVSS
jgi:hypothetical protein